MSQDGNGLSHGQYAKGRGELMALMNSMREHGAQAELDLPRIVCIGNQSAGKSSLVEAMSGIHVPRDSGTCTRSPLECRLSASDNPWSANVSLRTEFDDSTGKRVLETKSTTFGPPVNNPQDLELVLRRAQLAILNPNRDAKEFVQISADQVEKTISALKFSKNVICIDVSGPDMTELVFNDLPGIIQNAETKLIDLVEDVVKEYIKGDSIILVTIPMTDEVENQRAARLAKTEDPQGLRTIVALTKPDLVGAHSTRLRESWLAQLEGRGPQENQLQHGYYCTRQLDDEERDQGLSHEEARSVEEHFFKDTEPWASSTHKEHFGTPRLTEKLSVFLSQRIRESLPRIQETLRDTLDRTNAKLAGLPPALSDDLQGEVFYLITTFCKDLQAHVEGTRGSERLIQENNKEYDKFRVEILSTAPEFQFSPLTEETLADDHATSVKKAMGPEDIRALINSARTRELPNNVPYSAKLVLINQFTREWSRPVDKCLEAVRQQVVGKLQGLMTQHFERFPRLESQIRGLVMDEVERCYMKANEMLQTILTFETSPYTQNTHYYQTTREKNLAHYKALRSVQNASNPSINLTNPRRLNSSYPAYQTHEELHPGTAIDAAVAALVRAGYKVTALDLAKLVPNDKYEEEMIVAAEVDAFFQVSYKRIIDMVPLSIDHIFLRALSNGMQKILTIKLGMGDKGKAAELLTENFATVSARREMVTRKERLEKVRQELFKFGATFSS